MTVQEQLENVQEAIRRIENGAQSYRLRDGTEVRRADLATLYERERNLKSETSQATTGLFRPAGFYGC